ncbi:MAG: ATP-dependent transcriptional regulator, partial [Firmicutes bacterium]|nr:ATP-dependent transcriptional regulator [Bacillota bacterium]
MTKVRQQTTKNLYFSTRITEAMSGIFDHPLTIVEAPMGYGKTTAIKEFLSNSPVLWQTVHDAAPSGFWQEFGRLFTIIDDNSAQSLLELGVPRDSVLLQEAVRIIADVAFSDPTFLVIDDYHLLESPEIDRLVERMAMYGIPGLHIVLITRYSGRLNVEELALKGYLHIIAKETLELTPPEIVEYYKACGISLEAEETERLHALTEGWISALYLFMVELHSHGSYTPENNIYKLIKKTVYGPLAAETKEFLLTLSIFDSFTQEQASYMWGKENTDELLAEVMSNNAFVNYDSRSKTYFAHNILTGFLRELLAAQDPGYRQALWRKAADWCLQAGDYLAALYYFYECRDFDNILLTLEKNRSASFVGGNTKLIIKYLEECPETVKEKHPFALLIYAFYLFIYNEAELFGKTCREFSRVMATAESLNYDLRKRLLGEFELLLSFTNYNDIKKMSEHQRKACELLDSPTTIYNTEKNWTFGSPSVLYMFYRESGKLEEHISDLTKSFPYYHRLAGGHGSGGEYVMEAERYFNMGEFANAEISLHKASYKAEEQNETSILLCIRFLQNRLAFMNGDFALMVELLHTMRDELIGKKKYFYLHTVELCEGALYSYLGQKNKIPEWVTSGDLNNTQLMFPAFAMFNIVYG